MIASIQKISPFLWFDYQGREAAKFYCSIFENAVIHSESELVVEFELEGLRFTALNGGPRYQFTEAISFQVFCEDQEEVDHFWNSFVAEGGEEQMCGWCKDRFGLSWQVIPKRFVELMGTGTEEQNQRVMDAMLKMKKMIVSDLEAAFED